MTLNLSTNVTEQLLGPTAFETIFTGGRILVYSGAQPDSADRPVQGTLLGQITDSGNAWVANNVSGGLRFSRSGRWASKDATQSWRLVVSATGIAGWFRLVGKSPDDGDGSIHAPRIDGAIGVGGAVQLVLPTVNLTAGQSIPVQQFLYSIAPLGA